MVRLPISETFTSIQGEGSLTGVPSFFIRLSGCNLRCAWCDTPYASWTPDGRPREVAEIVQKAADSGVGHAVVTGGEPMIFEPIGELCGALRSAGLHITIETAGTAFRDLPCDLMSISPKLANSTPPVGDPRDPTGLWRERHEATRLNLPVLQKLLDRYPNRQFKFVVCSGDRLDRDIAEIDCILSQLRGLERHQIMLMPEGVSLPDPESAGRVAEICVKRGWRYCNRLHIQLYGNRRGT